LKAKILINQLSKVQPSRNKKSLPKMLERLSKIVVKYYLDDFIPLAQFNIFFAETW